MIRLVSGPLGTGKSYYGVRKAVQALHSGKLVATNFDLVDNWTERVARRGRFFPDSKRIRERAERMRGRYIRISNMQELTELKVRPEEPFAREVSPGKWALKEGVLVVLLDEAHRWMNARSWSREGREELLEFFALARKKGMEIYLIAQRAENLDVQVRELFEDHIRLVNLRRSARVMGIPVIPFNFFVANWINHADPGEVVKVERYRLGWEKRLYDTMDTVSFSEGERGPDNALWLPRRPEASDDRGTDTPSAAPAAGVAAPAIGAPGSEAPESDPGHAPPVLDPSLGG